VIGRLNDEGNEDHCTDGRNRHCSSLFPINFKRWHELLEELMYRFDNKIILVTGWTLPGLGVGRNA
jgi:hypothetical protein